MTKTEKRKWVKALRSGKYAQTIGGLTDSDGFCCLGVACDIGITEQNSNGEEYAAYEFLPEEIQQKLATFNDGDAGKGTKRRSFKWIAAYIERYL